MLYIKIDNMGEFIRKLLVGDTFDSFLMTEAYVKTHITYHLDGKVNKSFYDTEQLSGLPSLEYVSWSTEKANIYSLIKGKNKPTGFKIILILPERSITGIIEQNNLPITASDVLNMSLNIYFDGNSITLTSSASLAEFSADKTIERLWDTYLTVFLHKHNISYSSL